MADQEVNKTIEALKKELLKRGLTQEQAMEAINKTKLSDDEIKAILQEAKTFEDEIKEVELSTIPALAQEGYDLSVMVAKEEQKLMKVKNGSWFDAWTEKNFPAIKKATNELEKALDAKVEKLTSKETTDKLIEEKGDAFDFTELKLENDLALYIFKKSQFPIIDAKHKVTTKMRTDFMNAVNEQDKIKCGPIERRLDELNNKIMVIKETIAKTLFISLEEAHLVIVANNFFSTFFKTIENIEEGISNASYDVWAILKEVISEAHEAKQIEMKAKIEKLRAERLDN